MFHIRFFKKKWGILTAYFKKAEGFNLIELMTVIIIIGILSGISFPFYRSTRQRLALHRAASKLTQDIRKAQEMAMSAEDFPGGQPSTGGYGIYVQTGDAAIYLYANNSNPSDERYDSPGDIIIKKIYRENENIYIEKGIKLEKIVPDSSSTPISNVSVNFRPPDPIVKIKDNTGTEYNEKVTITLCIEGSDCSNSINYKEVIVNRVGLVYINE